MTTQTTRPPERRQLGLAPPFGQLLAALLRTAVVLGLGVVLATVRLAGIFNTETWFFWRQDVPVWVLSAGLIVALGLAPSRWLARLAPALDLPGRLWAFGLAGVCLVVGVFGAPLVFQGYVFSLDEVMANFDARIFAAGGLTAQVPAPWQPFATPLQPIFMLPFADHSVWASSYLPVNAAMRALALKLGAEGLVNPLLSAFAVVATWGVGRRLWPDQPQLALVAAALLGGSQQLIVTSMTAYAMPAHLAFNMAWLWLFLRGGRLGHAGALAVGFLACGIHQVAFHPLFAAPFVLQLWLDRRWRLAALYTVAYAAIGLFWIEYWSIAMGLTGLTAGAAHAGGGWFIQRALDVVSTVRISNFAPMAECLVRFVTWQNPLVGPLAVIGMLAAERAKGHLRSLVLGVFLTLVAMLFLEPTQTHGWGYRYLHGLLGSIALLAAWTWARITADLTPERQRAAAGGLVAACAVSLAVLTPLRAWQAWAYVDPYARASAAIARAPVDVVVVDASEAVAFNFGTEVRNDPFLRYRPKTMALGAMTANDVRQLCAAHSVAIFDGQSAEAFGIDVVIGKPNLDDAALRQYMAALKCGALIVLPAK